MLPLFHTGGFSWDGALVLVVLIATVPLISFVIDRRGKCPVDTVVESDEPPYG